MAVGNKVHVLESDANLAALDQGVLSYDAASDLEFVADACDRDNDTAHALVAGIGPVGLIGFQLFRLPVEIFLHGMYQAGQTPVQMTYAGLNFDIFSGLTAPAMAWLVWRGKAGRAMIWGWNIFALLLLVNIVTIGIFSLPTEFRIFMNEPANTFVAYVPYVWLPAVLVQAALLGHLLIFRWLWAQRVEY